MTVQRGKVTASAWMDNKLVTVMSTTTQPSEAGSVLRRQRNGSRIPVSCPGSIISYNLWMGGVDRGDQLRGYYHCRVKSREFYKYIFYFILDVSITNAFILYKHFCYLQHHIEVPLAVSQGDYSTRRRAGPGGGVIRPLPLQHFPMKINKEATEPERKRRRCVRCSERRKRTQTQWFCRECNVFLCHTGDARSDCFLRWHKDSALNQQ
jgi:hypothetical protein